MTNDPIGMNSKLITPEEFCERMQQVFAPKIGLDTADPETIHKRADELLCEVIESFGTYNEGLEVYRQGEKWHA